MSPSDATSNRNSSHRDASRVAGRIQSTLISNCLTESRWRQHLDECVKYHFHAAMVPPAWVKKTVAALIGTGIRAASFVDLPYGTMTGAGKAYEAGRLVDEGAEEIDLMPNIGFLLSGMEREYFEDIRGVVHGAGRVPVKIMLELPLLDSRQSEHAVALSIEAGAAYLKNASGGKVGIATVEQIRYLRRLAPPHVRIKASGGIKTAQQTFDLLDAGADLVGTSAAAEIMKELIEGGEPADQSSSNY